MNKRMLTFGLLFYFSTQALAGMMGKPSNVAYNPFDGFSAVGGFGGVELKLDDVSLLSRRGNAPFTFFNSQSLESKSSTNTGFKLGAEFGHTYSPVYLGFASNLHSNASMITQYQANNVVDEDPDVVIKGRFGATINYAINALFKAGYVRHDSMIYLQGGAAAANYNLSDLANLAGESRPVVSQEWTPGFALGGGIEHSFSQHLIGGVEYLYSKYDKIEQLVQWPSVTAPNFGPRQNVSTRFQTQEINVYMKYLFNC